MAGIPGKKSWRWVLLNTAAFYDFLLAPLTIVGAGITAFDFFWNARPIRASLLCLTAVVVVIITTAKAIVSFRQQRPRPAHELDGCLSVLHAILVDAAPGIGDCRVRVTIYRPSEDGKSLEQAMDYAGDAVADSTRVGRTFSVNCGIIGEAFRTKIATSGSRMNENFDAYVSELIHDWSYAESDARNASPEIFSWLAIPLVERDLGGLSIVRGVVYADATAPGFFNGPRVELAVAACVGIARFVIRRYHS